MVARARLATALTLALLAAVLVISARSQPAVEDARIGRRVELVELIRAEQARNAALAARVDELAVEVAELKREPTQDVAALTALQERVEELEPAAGMTAVAGPGLVVTLTDSPLRTSPSGDLNDLVIHEQDLQAVINALWAGDAEAMSVQGQRILATTAIRCVGNTLLLHGAVYSPPYVIEAVGDPELLRAALDSDAAVARFRQAVRDFQVGFDVTGEDELLVPAYEGSMSLQVARPAEAVSG
jgi:uncharacterized protein YlxW (UPF0749 family)